MNRKALGRGLGALLASDRTIELPEPGELEIDSIVPGPMQPRTQFDDESLGHLAESIKSHGIVQPVLVRRVGDHYELVAGERRWRAAKLAGLRTIPAVVKEIADKDLLEVALIENVQREDLNPIEEAQAYSKLIETVGLTQEALAERVGRDRSYITNYLRLLKLPEDIQQLVRQKRISTGHARTLLALQHVDLQRLVARQIIANDLSVRATEDIVRKRTERGSAPRRAPVAATVDPNVRAAESKLRRALGTQVRILEDGTGAGKVEISYFNRQDLDRLYTLIISACS
ncbi:MAG TPA: ParB/RepB/Spo0J family partition protein [Pyrinomonadaceae bacterium]|nr:ParB/RepB/Spo0J family partition protein [Pyrinomonadaceae bacterium]